VSGVWRPDEIHITFLLPRGNIPPNQRKEVVLLGKAFGTLEVAER